jgi:hypothetical protein
MRIFSFIFIFTCLILAGFVLAEKTGSYSDHLTLSKTSNGVIVVEGHGTPASFCGDGILQIVRGEQCDISDLGGQSCTSLGYDGGSLACQSNCLYDTSTCFNNAVAPSSSGGSSGSSGRSSGGSSGSKTCIESWNCTEWGPCEDGTQTRVCVDSHKCKTIKNKPFETLECEIGFSDGGVVIPVNDDRKLSGITGAVVGAFGNNGLWWIILILVVVLALLYFVAKKRKAGSGKKKFKKLVKV